MFASLIIISGFTAAIASALTVGALGSPIDGPEDLNGIRVVSIPDSSSAAWLDRRGIIFREVDSVEAGLDALRTEQADAMVYDAPLLSYRLRRDPSKALTLLPARFAPESYAFVLPTASPQLETMNRALLEVTEDSEWRDRVRTALGEGF
jgi:ABC-type amino acid transport substrate-binding protein